MPAGAAEAGSARVESAQIRAAAVDSERADSGRVAAVCRVAELFPVPSRGDLLSGIDKRPVAAPIAVQRHGIWGDLQGDREHHGGVFKAVYAYAREARDQLAAQEGREFPDGFFGENLVTEGIDTDAAVIGEIWQVGSTRLQATCSRTPCRTFADRVGERTWVRRFTEFGKPGTYFMVLTEGEISADDAITVEHRPSHGVTIADAFRGLDPEQAARLLDWAETTGTVLYHSLARNALVALERAGVTREFPASLTSDGRGDDTGLAPMTAPAATAESAGRSGAAQ